MNRINQRTHVYGRLFVEMAVILALTFLMLSPLLAEEGNRVGEVATTSQKPLSQFPKDVARLATGWVVIPQQMAEVSRDNGPLAGLSWGPIEGSRRLLNDTTEMVGQDEASYGSGKLFSYAF